MRYTFRSGLLSVTFRGKSPEDVVRLAEHSELEGIEWGGDVHVPAGRTKVAEQVRRWTEEAGLAVSAYGSYYKFEDIDPQAKERGPEIDAVLDTAEALGTGVIRIWPGSVGSAEATPEWRDVVIEQTRKFAGLAKTRELSLGFEFHDHSLTDSVDSTLALLKAVNCTNVSTFWQTNRSEGHSEALAGLKRVFQHVSNVHCHHLVGSLAPPFALLEEGISEWQDYLDVLRDTGETGRWVSIEFVRDGSVDAFLRDASTLRNLLAAF